MTITSCLDFISRGGEAEEIGKSANKERKVNHFMFESTELVFGGPSQTVLPEFEERERG
jgi:hypothetical protein